MGHLNITGTTLLLAFLTFTSQSFNVDSKPINTEKLENPNTVTYVEHRGSGR